MGEWGCGVRTVILGVVLLVFESPERGFDRAPLRATGIQVLFVTGRFLIPLSEEVPLHLSWCEEGKL